MRKWKLLSVTVLTLLLFTGCQNPDISTGAADDSASHKEQPVTSLTPQNDTSVDTEDTSDNSSTEITDSEEFYGDTLESLEESVNEIVQKIANASVSGTANEKYDSFIQLNSELQEIENQLDYYEQNTENDFEQGKLSYDEARQMEFEIEKLEDLLDGAEETLEYKFGYDD